HPGGLRFSVSACPLKDQDGTVRGGISLIRDITERCADDERRVRRFSALLELTRRGDPDPADLSAALDTIVRGAAAALGVERVGIWRFSPDRTSISCVARMDASGAALPELETLSSEQFPGYFEALRSSTVVDAGSALTDPRTQELAETYLQPRGIHAMLD